MVGFGTAGSYKGVPRRHPLPRAGDFFSPADIPETEGGTAYLAGRRLGNFHVIVDVGTKLEDKMTLVPKP